MKLEALRFRKPMKYYKNKMSYHKNKESKKAKKSFFKKKITIALFALVALVGGVYFLDKPITGNVILNKHRPIHSVSIIGLLLIICSITLVLYYIYKNK